MKPNFNYNFSVSHTINFQLFEINSSAASTYEVQFEQMESKNFKIELRRNNFKVNGQKIELKFEKIAHEYNKALFPVLFNVKEGSFALSNYNEIKERIAAKDEELKQKHEGPGFDYIRNQFLENVVKDGYAMTNYFFSFGLMKVIMLCFQEAGNYDQYDFHWDIVPLGTILAWKGKIHFNGPLKKLNFEGKNADTNILFGKIKQYGIENKFPQKVNDEESLITASVTSEIQFTDTQLDFEFSETEVKINSPYFDYKETLSIQRQ